MGRTSGWTWGVVTQTCVSVLVGDASYVPINSYATPGARVADCSYGANYYATDGDSGAPVFGWQGEPATWVWLSGIHWGHSGPTAWFNPQSKIEEDFGGRYTGAFEATYPVGRPDANQSSTIVNGRARLQWTATENASFYFITRCDNHADGRGCVETATFTTSDLSFLDASGPTVSSYIGAVSYTPSGQYAGYTITAYAANGLWSGPSSKVYYSVSWWNGGGGDPY